MLSTARYAKCLLTAAILAVSAYASANAPQCRLQNALEISSGNHSIVIASNQAFEHYQFLLVDPVFIDSGNTLSSQQQARLRNTIKQTIEQDWRERLGWRSSKRAGDQVLRLNIHINDIVTDKTDTTLQLDASLSDSLTGEPLIAQCNETLNLNPQVASLGGNGGVFWNTLQTSVKHWGAGLGSHIMTAY